MTVHSFRTRALFVSPIRLALGLILLVAARVGGATSGPALLAFVLGGARRRRRLRTAGTRRAPGRVCAGLGPASLISLTRIDPRLYSDPKTHVVYRSPDLP